MKHTTLCYIENEDKYLMLYRNKKENDENLGKWVGIGGKLEAGESPFDCARREIREETGLLAEELRYRGIITFVSSEYGTEYMHLFTCNKFSGELRSECEEGEPRWIRKSEFFSLPMWEGDKIFLELLDTEERFFSLKLEYSGDVLISHTLEFAKGAGR